MRIGPWFRGRSRCAFGKSRKAKLVYADADDAWTGAFLLFSDTGRIATPYLCSSSVAILSRIVICRNGNPWSVRAFETHRAKDQFIINGCGEWHLTSRSWFLLPKGVSESG